MKLSVTFLGLLVALLLLAACGPAETDVISNEAGNDDFDILVYASPL